MARKRGQQGPGRPMPGFRPGKEPPRVRKQRAKQQLGEVNAAQERLIEAFAERSPEQSRALIRRWLIGLLAGAIVLAVVGAVLYAWSVIAGVVVHVIAAALLFLWWRLRRQRADLEAMADVVAGRGGGGGGRRGRG
ncbi:MAG: hypothetical protein ACODAE_09320 [Gemmatimonadota bacterium]